MTVLMVYACTTQAMCIYDLYERDNTLQGMVRRFGDMMISTLWQWERASLISGSHHYTKEAYGSPLSSQKEFGILRCASLQYHGDKYQVPHICEWLTDELLSANEWLLASTCETSSNTGWAIPRDDVNWPVLVKRVLILGEQYPKMMLNGWRLQTMPLNEPRDWETMSQTCSIIGRQSNRTRQQTNCAMSKDSNAQQQMIVKPGFQYSMMEDHEV